jgi:tellurite resistance protein
MPSVLSERLAPLIAAFKKDDLGIVVDIVVIAAYADGEIDAAELAALREACEAAFGAPMPEETARNYIEKSKAQIKAAGGDGFATQVGKQLKERKMGEAALRVAFTVANASRGISDEERDRLVILGEGAGLSERAVLRIGQEIAPA